MHDWYIAFSEDYVSGTVQSDGDENDLVLWLDTDEALDRNDVPQLTKSLIKCAISGSGLEQIDYNGNNPPCSLYGIIKDIE